MNKAAFIAVLPFAGFLFLSMIQQKESGNLSPREAFDLRQKDSSVIFLDVRTPSEFSSETGHIGGAILIPVQDLEKRIGELDSLKSRTIIAYCRSGNRSRRAAEILSSKGFTVSNMTGGIMRWNAESLPVTREPH